MTFFKAQKATVQTVDGPQVVRVTGRNASGIWCTIKRVPCFVPDVNVIEWMGRW